MPEDEKCLQPREGEAPRGGVLGAHAADGGVARRGNEALLESLFEKTPDAILIADDEGRYEDANPAACRLLGMTRAELLLRSVASVMPEGVDVGEAWGAFLRDGSARGEVDLRRADGGVVRVDFSSIAHVVPGLHVWVLREVFSVAAPDDRLRESQAAYRALLDNGSDVAVVLSHGADVLWVSPAIERMLGHRPEALRGTCVLKLVHPEEQGKAERAFRQAFEGTGERSITELRVMARSGAFCWVEAVAIGGLEGLSDGVVVTMRDVTQRKQAEEGLRATEEQLRQSQKMEAIGRLAGGVAHDFNNLLSIILSYSDLVREELGEGHPLRADMAEIKAAGERASELTAQLLAFSRRQITRPRRVDLNDLLVRMQKMLQRLLGEEVELEIEQGPDLGVVWADPTQIEQVVMNLAVNARDAMPGGGRLSFETQRVDVAAETGAEVPPGSYALLMVTDTGGGMDRETLGRIFEPFFTTKERGKGTGLGLSTVFGIVQQAEGQVRVWSEPGRGAQFRIYLPSGRAPAMIASEPPPRTLPPVSPSGGTILLVEDDPQVRLLAKAVLSRRGYRLMAASDALEALELASNYPEPIDLLLTDVVMPRINGRQLADRLREQRPGTRVLFMSGYTDDVVLERGVRAGEVDFLPKPLTPRRLWLKVREVLGR